MYSAKTACKNGAWRCPRALAGSPDATSPSASVSKTISRKNSMKALSMSAFATMNDGLAMSISRTKFTSRPEPSLWPTAT